MNTNLGLRNLWWEAFGGGEGTQPSHVSQNFQMVRVCFGVWFCSGKHTIFDWHIFSQTPPIFTEGAFQGNSIKRCEVTNIWFLKKLIELTIILLLNSLRLNLPLQSLDSMLYLKPFQRYRWWTNINNVILICIPIISILSSGCLKHPEFSKRK